MAILVGIDEAGYGPLLGPLMVSATAFSVPDDLLKADHWRLLSRAVARRKKNLAGRLLITDSKKAYSRSSGITHLRRTVLASLLTLDRCSRPPRRADELLDALRCPSAGRLAEYEWYNTLSDKGLGDDDGAVGIASAVLSNSLSANNMKLVNMTCRCLDVGYYNRMVSAVKNKATVLFTAVSDLINDAYEGTYDSQSDGMLQIIVDRQGGRIDYTRPLRRMFSELDLKVIRQDNSLCSYELTGKGRTMRLHFVVKADEKYLPVALASMTGKYVREILVDAINRYFISHCADLKPTAGYWQDGQRFIKDLQTHLPHIKYDPEKLIRQR